MFPDDPREGDALLARHTHTHTHTHLEYISKGFISCLGELSFLVELNLSRGIPVELLLAHLQQEYNSATISATYLVQGSTSSSSSSSLSIKTGRQMPLKISLVHTCVESSTSRCLIRKVAVLTCTNKVCGSRCVGQVWVWVWARVT